jgi:hypothetical protein
MVARPDTRIATHDLLNTLNDDEESGLGEANHGRSITAYWLREHLRGLLDPPGSQEWHVGEGTSRKHIHGYEWHQLVDACRRYRILCAEGESPSGTSGTSGSTPASGADLAEISCPGCVPDVVDAGPSGADPGQEISRDAAASSDILADGPDAPDGETLICENTPSAAGKGDAGEGQTPAEASAAAETIAPQTEQASRTRRHPRKRPSEPPPEPQQIAPEEYTAGTLPAAILRLRSENPNRSLGWLAKKTGQPKSYIKQVLGIPDGEAS